MNKLPPGPWDYRPNMHDDWGFVRDATGAIVAHTCPFAVAEEFTQNTQQRLPPDEHGHTLPTPEWQAGPPQARAVAELLIQAEARERTGGWIAVEKQLPGGDSHVLVASADGIDLGHFHSGDWWGTSGRLRGVSHWQPLPSLPKEPANAQA